MTRTELFIGSAVLLLGLSGFLAAPQLQREPPPTPQPVVRQAPCRGEPPARGTVTVASSEQCAQVMAAPLEASSELVHACGEAGLLGACHVWKRCPTCVCDEYVGSTTLCENGKCGAPLNGTGCASSAFYGPGNSEFRCTGSDREVAACMLRRLITGGHCAG